MAGDVTVDGINGIAPRVAPFENVNEEELKSRTNILIRTETPVSTEAQYGLEKILKSDECPKALGIQSDLRDLLDDLSKPDAPAPVISAPKKQSDVDRALTDLEELEKATEEKPAEKPEVAKIPEVSKEPVIPEEKTVSEKSAEQEEKISLLPDLLAEIEANKNKPAIPKQINKFDERADKAVRAVGDGIISPVKALSGIKDIVTGDFSEGQESLRNAVADFANTPAQAVNFVTAGLEAAVNDFAGETAGKIVAAPLKAASGIWETGVALVKPEEGSVKKAFSKITFGLFD